MMTSRVVATALLLGAAATRAGATERHGHGMSVSTERHGRIENCGQLRVSFDDVVAARSEETISAPALAGGLRMRAPRHSGIFVEGADRSDVSVTACKAAAEPGDLARIAVALSDGELVARGPEGLDWVVFWIVRAPRSTPLDLEVSNGPASVRGMAGTVVARAENGPLSFEQIRGRIAAEAKNGPISVKDCPGRVEASAVNGPIHVAGNRGDVNVSTQNGPISVKLRGSQWDGRLEARAKNGPLSLSLPDGYASAVSVESSGRSPFQCRARACEQARRNWDEDSRRVEFGDSFSPVVHLSTVNGPVSIRSDRSAED